MPRSARQHEPTERRFFYELPLFVLAGAVLVEAVVPGTSASLAGWPLVVSLFFVGMPHGAVDFSLNNYLSNSARPFARLISFAGYLMLLVASLLLFVASPVTALILFLLLSATHFGLADARGLDARFEAAAAPWLRTLSAATRGGLMVALPFVCSPDESLAVFSNIVSIAGYEPTTVSISYVVTLAAAVISFAVVSHGMVTISRVRSGQLAIAAVEALESGLVCLAFFTLHPLFAMGLYFLAWHSWRHMCSLMRLEPFAPAGQSTLPFISAVARIHVRSLALLLPTLVIFIAVAWWRLEAWSVEALAALTIAFYAVVTLPHHLLVEQLCTERSAERFADDAVVADLAVAECKTAEDFGSPLASLNIG